MVKAEESTPEALLAALKAGQMYASTGPSIHDVTWGETSVHVRCSPAASVIVQGRGSGATAVHGNAMGEAVVSYGPFRAAIGCA